MVWVSIALAIPLLILLLLQFLRFHFSIHAQTPATLQGSLGISFLWFRREMTVDAGRAFSSKADGEGETGDPEGKKEDPEAEAEFDPGREFPGQRGALRIPGSWQGYFSRLRSRFRQAGAKWMLDFQVWRALIGFAFKSGRRIIRLLHPALKSFHLGMEDVYDLGRIAAAWSVLRGALPALTGDAEFGFAETFNFRAKVTGGFTGLNVLFFGLTTLFSFPWVILGGRFAHCWRDPRLNRWQRRVLLP